MRLKTTDTIYIYPQVRVTTLPDRIVFFTNVRKCINNVWYLIPTNLENKTDGITPKTMSDLWQQFAAQVHRILSCYEYTGDFNHLGEPFEILDEDQRDEKERIIENLMNSQRRHDNS